MNVDLISSASTQVLNKLSIEALKYSTYYTIKWSKFPAGP